jgi:hypothetical protein
MAADARAAIPTTRGATRFILILPVWFLVDWRRDCTKSGRQTTLNSYL